MERIIQDLALEAIRDLRALDDWELAGTARKREIAYQDALGEIERRRAERPVPAWDEKSVAAALALKRDDQEQPFTLRQKSTLPPALFRMGYEWAVLTIVEVLHGVVSQPSEMGVMIEEYETSKNGWMKSTGKRNYYDPRRAAAYDLIDMIRSFAETRQKGMFAVPRYRSSYHPDQDDTTIREAIKRAAEPK